MTALPTTGFEPVAFLRADNDNRRHLLDFTGNGFSPAQDPYRPPDRPNPRKADWVFNPSSARIGPVRVRGTPIRCAGDGPQWARPAANDNAPPPTKPSLAWPAMARAKANTLLEGQLENRLAEAVLLGFASLYEAADIAAEGGLPSQADGIRSGTLTAADLGIEKDDEGLAFGFGSVDRRFEYSANAAARHLMEAHKHGRLKIVGGSYLVKGRRFDPDRFHRPRGPRSAAECPTVGSSETQTRGASAPARSQESQLVAAQQFEALRNRLGPHVWYGLVALAVHRCTARQLGEWSGLTFKRAEKRGGELMTEIMLAAIAALRPASVNDNTQQAIAA